MASVPDPVQGATPQYAGSLQLVLSLKGQLVQNYSFDKPEITVGRDPYCDVYVENPGVSRQHFKIDRGDTGEFRVTDLGSSNGTYLNDRPVRVGTVRDGDVIQFGKYSLRLELNELIGGEDAAARKHSAAEGATMMLSPSEVRQMVAEARGGAAPAPKLAVVPRGAAPRSEPVAEKAKSQNWLPWVVVGVVAALALASAMFFSR